MRKWNFIVMGQVGVTGVVTAKVAKPIASSIARRTGRSEDQVFRRFSGQESSVVSLIYTVRTAEAVIAAGRNLRSEPRLGWTLQVA